jgi:hypothetical protein
LLGQEFDSTVHVRFQENLIEALLNTCQAVRIGVDVLRWLPVRNDGVNKPHTQPLQVPMKLLDSRIGSTIRIGDFATRKFGHERLSEIGTVRVKPSSGNRKNNLGGIVYTIIRGPFCQEESVRGTVCGKQVRLGG